MTRQRNQSGNAAAIPSRRRLAAAALTFTLLAIALAAACAPASPYSPDDLLNPMLGGDTSVALSNATAFESAARNLNNDECRIFAVGDSFSPKTGSPPPPPLRRATGLAPHSTRNPALPATPATAAPSPPSAPTTLSAACSFASASPAPTRQPARRCPIPHTANRSKTAPSCISRRRAK